MHPHIKQFILEKKIKVGSNLEDKLGRIPVPLAKKLLSFLNSDKVKDDALVDEIDYDPQKGKNFIVRYKDRMGNTKEKQVKIGKLLTYLGANTEIGNAKGYEIQDLVSYLKKENTDDVKLLDGEDIRAAYLCTDSNKGGLSKSCMRHSRTQSFLDIYVENPDSVKLAVVYDEVGNIDARALLWKMDNGGAYLDRIYGASSESEAKLKSYGQKIGATLYSSPPPSDVTVKEGEYDYYPYMDTFTYYDPDGGALSAHDDTLPYTLENTDGTYTDNNGVWSDAYGETIPEDYAVYVESEGDYFYDHDVVTAYNDEVILMDKAGQIDKGEYEGQYADIEDLVTDYEGESILLEEADEIEVGPENGGWVHDDEKIQNYDGLVFEEKSKALLLRGPHAMEYQHEDEVVEDWLGFSHPDPEYDSNIDYIALIDYGDFEGEYAMLDELVGHKDGGMLLKREAYEIDGGDYVHYEQALDEDSEYYDPKAEKDGSIPKEVAIAGSQGLQDPISKIANAAQSRLAEAMALVLAGDGDGKFTPLYYGLNQKQNLFTDGKGVKDGIRYQDEIASIADNIEISEPILEGLVDDRLLSAINALARIKNKKMDIKGLASSLQPFTKDGLSIEVVKSHTRKSSADKRYTILPFIVSLAEG